MNLRQMEMSFGIGMAQGYTALVGASGRIEHAVLVIDPGKLEVGDRIGSDLDLPVVFPGFLLHPGMHLVHGFLLLAAAEGEAGDQPAAGNESEWKHGVSQFDRSNQRLHAGTGGGNWPLARMAMTSGTFRGKENRCELIRSHFLRC